MMTMQEWADTVADNMLAYARGRARRETKRIAVAKSVARHCAKVGGQDFAGARLEVWSALSDRDAWLVTASGCAG